MARPDARGGLGGAARVGGGCRVGGVLDERALPLSDAVRGACELLGLDPLHVANEGKLLAVVAPADASPALDCMRGHPLGASAAVIGEVTGAREGLVRGALGGLRVLDEPSGAPLPRLC